MRSLVLFVILAAFTLIVRAQSTSDVLKQAAGQGVKEGAKEGATVATEKTADKVTDKILGKIFDKKKKTTTTNNSANNNATSNSTNSNSGSTATTDNSKKDNGDGSGSFKTYSKFDFIPGDKILAYDDFSKDAVGDFPATWNTNSSGEVVTASGLQGQWLMVKKQGKFVPEYIKTLPDNFTFEYDVVCNDKYSYYSPFLSLYFLSGNNAGKEVFEGSFIPLEKRSGVKIGVHPTNGTSNGGTAQEESFDDGTSVIKNDINTSQFNSVGGKTKLHVSVWRQKQRLRVYFNEEKVYDLPRAFADNKTYATVLFEIWGDLKDQDRYLIGNIKLAAGAPDTRNKLITEGKFVTSGILFDVNSDKIKPQSYGVMKDIGNVLTENSSVKVKIVGHTDSDGKDADNLSLSKRRAEAVKASLVKDFGIDASRLETDGKGASQPVDTNNTAEGKANNRRVEFIKE
jgi:outer membrane protein OmpA-like peptidoglycan-associated protein